MQPNAENQADQLVKMLKVSEGANRGFDHLVGLILDACKLAEGRAFTKAFGDTFAVEKIIASLDLLLVGGGGDPRVLEIARILLRFSGLSENECFIDEGGQFHRRQVYFAQRSDGAVKIGSTINVQSRLSQLKTAAGELKLLHACNGSFDVEKAFHQEFAADRIEGEWFSPRRVLKFIDEAKAAQADAETNSFLERLQPTLLPN